MFGDPTHMALTYALCGALVVLYASARFNTPVTNRSSTVQLWYWQGLVAYIVTSITLFAVLSIVLEQPKLREFLLTYNPQSVPSGPGVTTEADRLLTIPPALAATLVMTTLLPSVPYIKQLDSALLNFFLRMACIPAEVVRRARILNHANLRLTSSDLQGIEVFIHNTALPNEAAQFLRARAEAKWEDSELRFTKVLLILRRLDALQEDSRYAKFFADNANDYRMLWEGMLDFAERSAKGLNTARWLRENSGKAEYEQLISEKREAFKRDCMERFGALSLFLARAVLQSELIERDVRERLRSIGFEQVAVSAPFIPIHELAVLSVLILIYFLLAGLALPPPPGIQHASEFKWVPFEIALVHVVTIGTTLWLMHAFAWARRGDGRRRPFASYLLCGLFGALIMLTLSVLFDLARTGTLPDEQRLGPIMPFLFLSGARCVIVAFLCDDRPPSVPEPIWFRASESLGCAVMMGFVAWMLVELFPSPHASVSLLVRILLPAGTGLIVGFMIPSLHRAGLRGSPAISPNKAHEMQFDLATAD